uniref:Uncharacterized protein n=1 Tax=Pithovirus LCPAC101 TaxID=2506586 RepID=A0A481Z3P3_9VIRU|nr:MAG: uncharacterized protein LCPAC101_03590 [Pithovirus LCPAC101]
MRRIVLNQTKGITSENLGELNVKENWIRSFLPGVRNVDAFTELERSFESNFTHSGLIYYLHHCWSKEIGCVIRPDMIWHTVISEIAHKILQHPDKYKYIFSDTSGKQDIIIETMDITNINIELLTNEISKIIKNKEFADIINNTRFKSEEVNAHLAIQMAFASMSTPYFSYMTSMCGIPSVDVEGNFMDWYKIIEALEKFKNIFVEDDKMLKYFDDVRNVVGNIICRGGGDDNDDIEIYQPSDELFSLSYINKGKCTHRINDITSNSPEDRFNTETFWNDIFRYDKNVKCGSGHTPELVYGWITKLYINDHSEERDLFSFNNHLNYVPYKNIESGKMFCKVIGLTYSYHDTKLNVLVPKYGSVRYQINDKKIFNKLAKI